MRGEPINVARLMFQNLVHLALTEMHNLHQVQLF